MTDPLIALFDPLLQPLTRRLGLSAACSGIARLLNAAALDGLCGHRAHGDRLIEAISGRDAPPALRRLLASMVASRRQLWPEDRRILRGWDIQDVPGGVSLTTECEELDATRAATLGVQMLVDVPPASVGELRSRLAGLPVNEVREALLDLLRSSSIRDQLLDVVCAAYDVVDGPGRSLRPLAELAADEDVSAPVREAAWRVVVSCAEAELQGALDLVDAPMQQELTALGTAAMMRRLVSHPDGAAGLTEHLGALDPEERRELIWGMEEIRGAELIPAAALYGPLLATRAFPELDDVLVPPLVDAGGPGAEHALSQALAAEQDSGRARLLRRGLLDVRTARIEPAPQSDHVRAWVGMCDGHGAFPVLLATQNERMRYRLATVVARCEGELRDGSTLQDIDVVELGELVAGYRGISELAEVPPALAAAFVADALHAGAFGELPIPLQHAADEVMGQANHEVALADVDHAPCPTLSDVRGLYLLPTLHTWFLDGADLRACDIPVPPLDAGQAIGWSREHAPRVSDPRVRHRIGAMALHLARWALLIDEPDVARVAAGALDDLEQGGDLLMRAVLEQTAFTAVDGPAPEIGIRFGSEDLREEVRMALAPCPPRGRDLGELDLTDLLLSSDRDLCSVHVDAAHMRPDDRRRALRAAGHTLATSMAKGVEGDLTRELHESLAEHGVPTPAVAPIASAILQAATRFLHEVCKECPVQCWSIPNEPVGRAWLGPGHPALID